MSPCITIFHKYPSIRDQDRTCRVLVGMPGAADSVIFLVDGQVDVRNALLKAAAAMPRKNIIAPPTQGCSPNARDDASVTSPDAYDLIRSVRPMPLDEKTLYEPSTVDTRQQRRWAGSVRVMI